MLHSATELLDNHGHVELLTLDFFDTLVTRAVAQPTHVFAEVEKRLCTAHGGRWRGYARQRVRAEQRARQIAAADDRYRDVSLAEIIAELSVAMDLSLDEQAVATESECQTEVDLVRPVPFGVQLVAEAHRRGLAILVMSDNYMSAQHIANMARAAGYTGINETNIMVSCEHGGLKHNGRLWREMLDLTSVAPRKILHVGDDREADVNQPSRLGIATYRDPRMRISHRHLENTHPAVLPLSKMEAWLRDDMYETGWETPRALGAGAFALLVAAQIADVLSVISQREVAGVYFAARDGWLAHQVWGKTLEDSVKVPAKYLAFSRSVFGRASISHVEDAVALRFIDQHERLTPRQLGDRFGCTLRSSVHDGTVLGADQLRALLVENEDVVVAASQKLRERVVGYLHTMGITSPGHHVVVDVGWTGATLADLAELVREASNGRATIEGRFLGLYWDATPHRTRVAMNGYAMDDLGATDDNLRLLGVIRYFETLMTAPHGSVIDFTDATGNFTPLFAQSDIETNQHNAVIGHIADAVIESASSIVRKDHPTGVTVEEITGEVAWATMMQVGHTPRRDEVDFMSKLRHVASVDHQDDGIPLIAQAPRFSSTLPFEKTQQLYEQLMKNYWMQGTLRMWARHKETSVLAQDMLNAWPIAQPVWVESTL